MNENKIIKKLEAFNFFRIEVIADFEYEGKIYKNYKQYNNDSILNSNNWELHKETFFNQRMNFYKESYTLSEKIKLEIEALENLTTNETDYKILKDRYNSFLSNKQNPPQQVESVNPDEVTRKNWFIIGLLFANGEMAKLLKTHKNNATKIATELENKDGFRPYISESIGVKKKISDKSVYSDYYKMKTIIEYCKDKNIEIQSEFLMRFKDLEQEQ